MIKILTAPKSAPLSLHLKTMAKRGPLRMVRKLPSDQALGMLVFLFMRFGCRASSFLPYGTSNFEAGSSSKNWMQ